jgi:hypothetical protein
MPLYHFHVVDEHVSLDLSIVDLPDHDAALARAEQFVIKASGAHVD